MTGGFFDMMRREYIKELRGDSWKDTDQNPNIYNVGKNITIIR
jgi:hypothetical protein